MVIGVDLPAVHAIAAARPSRIGIGIGIGIGMHVPTGYAVRRTSATECRIAYRLCLELDEQRIEACLVYGEESML